MAASGGGGRGIARWQARARRALRRPPGEVVRRAVFEAKAWLDRGKGVPSARYSDVAFARLFGMGEINALWEALRAWPYPAITNPLDPAALDAVARDESTRIGAAARRARALQVDLLGSGPTTLAAAPRDIDWHCDFKSGHRWPLDHFRDLDLNDLGRPSDVKVPWELSRLQWLIPVGQDFLLHGDPAHARFAREVLESWIVANPYARGPNWGVAMEAAMRIFTWTWLFHVFAHSEAWTAPAFRGSFLRSIYDHAIFCARYLEDFGRSTNHLVAGAAGISVAGLFLGPSPIAREIASFGLGALHRSLARQLAADGVNHEGSAAYHRLVAELVLMVVRYWNALGLARIDDFVRQLARMADVTAALTGPDGLVPGWGDGDDGRVLPFGGQPPNDHSYLPVLIQGAIGAPVSPQVNRAAAGEIVWSALPVDKPSDEAVTPTSRAFRASGLYVMTGARDHVTVYCGPVGHAHGHNDALSLEAVLDGVRLITDSGSYVYTSAPAERDAFRSAAAHNAPIVDGAEPNPFIAGELFLLRDRAKARMIDWQTSDALDRFVGTHQGYAVRPTRTLTLDKTRHRLTLRDDFAGGGAPTIQVRLQFVAGAMVIAGAPGRWTIGAGGKTFEVALATPDWTARLAMAWESPRYGVKVARPMLEFTRTGAPAPLEIAIYPL